MGSRSFESVFRQFVKKKNHKKDHKKIDADEQRLKKTQFQGRVFLALPKSLLAQGLRFSFSEEKKEQKSAKMVLFGSNPTDFKVVEYKNDYKKLLYVTFTEPYSALLARLDAVKKSVEKVKAPSLNTVWNAPGRWNPTKWRGLSTSATKTFRLVDIDGNAIKKQFRYVAKSYDRK